MASYDKIVKYLAERIEQALAPLDKIVQNQTIIIAQNKQVIDLLSQINTGRLSELEEKPAESISEPADPES